jgi:hypothetical protein
MDENRKILPKDLRERVVATPRSELSADPYARARRRRDSVLSGCSSGTKQQPAQPGQHRHCGDSVGRGPMQKRPVKSATLMRVTANQIIACYSAEAVPSFAIYRSDS